MQYTDGTQRLEEPVSKMTVKFCGGEPIEMVPKYSICEEGGHITLGMAAGPPRLWGAPQGQGFGEC